MHRAAWASSIAKGRLLRKRDWVADALGLCLVTALHVTGCFLVGVQLQGLSSRVNLLPLLGLGAVSLPLYALHCLSKENDLTPIETHLSATENHRLVVLAFRSLGWDISTSTRFSITARANNRWWRGAGQTATALIADNTVYLNVIHGGTSKGRLPFYFGSNQRKLNRAIAALESGKTLFAYKTE